MKTIGNIIHQKKFPLYILDNSCNLVYTEFVNGYWEKKTYDSKGVKIFWETAYGVIEDDI